MPTDTNKSPSAETRGIPESRTNEAAAAAPDQHVPGENLDHRQDKLLDQALEETFPNNDPISPKQITK